MRFRDEFLVKTCSQRLHVFFDFCLLKIFSQKLYVFSRFLFSENVSQTSYIFVAMKCTRRHCNKNCFSNQIREDMEIVAITIEK